VALHQCRCIALVVAALSAAGAAAADQSGAPGDAQQKIASIGADLFSTIPHVAEDINELKAVLAAEPQLAEAHLLLGIAYRAQGSPDLLSESVAELRQAVALNPSLVLARVTVARVYMDMARASRARQELETALEQAPGNPQILALLGEAERQLGDPARAVELNRQALATDSTFVQARFYLGLALLDLKQHAEAIRELQQVVKSGANGAEASLGLGMAYLAAGRVDEAVATLREAVRLDPSRPGAHLQLARAYRLKGVYDDALKEQKLALPSGPANLGVLYTDLEQNVLMEEGLVRLAQGRLEAAAAAFQKVLDLDASADAAKKQLALVRKRIQERDRKKSPGRL
jgi:tetratricopeptide (TPR) repeat protein